MTQHAYLTKLTSMYRKACVLALAGLVIMSCSGSPTSPSSSAGGGNLRLMLTDDPIDDVDEVNIFFTTVTVKPVGKPVEELDLELTENPINLLTLETTVTEFAAGLVPAGDYEFIHINIDESKSSIVVNGMKKSLKIPSQEIKIVGGFTVGETGSTMLTLDFDAKASLLLRGNDEWLLRPVVVVTGKKTDS